jgi:hypothetical protein
VVTRSVIAPPDRSTGLPPALTISRNSSAMVSMTPSQLASPAAVPGSARISLRTV